MDDARQAFVVGHDRRGHKKPHARRLVPAVVKHQPRIEASADKSPRRFKRAVTDSGSEIVARPDKPGVSNLLDILSAVSGSDLGTLEDGYTGKGYGALKVDVAEAVIEGLRPIQARYAELDADRGELARMLDRGAERAREIANPVLAEVRERVGLVGSVS